jgi:hypothetical protein
LHRAGRLADEGGVSVTSSQHIAGSRCDVAEEIVMKLVHISDIHINAEPILGHDSIANFKACLAYVEAHDMMPTGW